MAAARRGKGSRPGSPGSSDFYTSASSVSGLGRLPRGNVAQTEREQPALRSGPGIRLRILMVIDSLDMGGAERHLVDLALAMRRLGHEVTVACSSDGSLSTVLRESGVAVEIRSERLVKRRASLLLALWLRRLVHQGRFDVVHSHMYASSFAAACATVGIGSPLVVTEHSQATWRGRPSRLLSRWIYRRAARIIAVAGPIYQRLISVDQVAEDLVTVIPNALPAMAAPVVKSRDHGQMVGLVARLRPEKGVGIFLEATARLAEEFPSCRYLIVGDGPMKQELEQRASRLGLSDRIQFMGFHPNAREVIRSLDLLVVPSLSEGTPLVVLEAMSEGVPVVAARVGGIPEQIRHGREGLLVPAGDAEALAGACAELLRDPERSSEMGRAGRLRVLSHFNHDDMVAKTHAVYRSVLVERHPA